MSENPAEHSDASVSLECAVLEWMLTKCGFHVLVLSDNAEHDNGMMVAIVSNEGDLTIPKAALHLFLDLFTGLKLVQFGEPIPGQDDRVRIRFNIVGKARISWTEPDK